MHDCPPAADPPAGSLGAEPAWPAEGEALEPSEEADAAARIAAAAPALDADAEALLCRRLAPRVRRYGLRHLRDAHAANDLMQAVLVRTIEQLRGGQVREPRRIVSFVFGMCRLVLLEQQRRDARRERLLAQWGHALGDGTVVDSPRLDHHKVADCLQRLAERERSVIVMSFYEDRSAADVASLLGTTAGNVRVIRHRGLHRLRACVEGGAA